VSKWISINGHIEVDTEEEFNKEFLIWLESKGYSFIGVTKEEDGD